MKSFQEKLNQVFLGRQKKIKALFENSQGAGVNLWDLDKDGFFSKCAHCGATDESSEMTLVTFENGNAETESSNGWHFGVICPICLNMAKRDKNSPKGYHLMDDK